MAKARICGHRGVAAQAPENTLAGIALAVRLGLTQVEVDLRLTADGRVVLHHDPELGRTVAGRGRIGEMEYAALRDLDAGAWFGPEFQGQRVPTLEGLFAASGPALTWNLELKIDPEDAPARRRLLVRTVRDLASAAGVESRILLTSFDHDLIREIALGPGSPPCGFILGDRPPTEEEWEAPVDVFSMRYSLVTPELAERVHGSGRRLHVWTVNDPDVHRAMLACGVDTVISDDPAALSAIR